MSGIDDLTLTINGWENIGKFLGVSGRTARTYHYIYSMPVHRKPGPRRTARTYIFPDEVLTWLRLFEAERKKREGKGKE